MVPSNLGSLSSEPPAFTRWGQISLSVLGNSKSMPCTVSTAENNLAFTPALIIILSVCMGAWGAG